jgi:DNA-binding response OmpR family regulator
MVAKILVVDDDESIRELLRLHLANAGYEVELADDAVTAGRALLRSPPDLVLVDVDMPFMDGYEFVSLLKSDALTMHIPVIFLTAAEHGRSRGYELGAVAYLTKPLLVNQLLAAVAKHVPEGRQPIA